MANMPIGLQLWSVRQACAEDLPGTLQAIADMGYDGVEFAGYHGYGAAELRDMLASAGLAVCGSHLGIDRLLGDALAETLSFENMVGNHHLVIPFLAEKHRDSAAAWKRTAGLLTERAGLIGDRGMRLGYHNHRMEFEPVDGEIPMDILAENTPQEFFLQLDIGHCLRTGADPCAYLRRYPGRYVTVHVRDWSAANEQAIVGEGEVPWQEVFAICEESGATEWYIVEQTAGEVPELAAVERCIANLRAMGK
jgi:sugar phosphate isomerase/epimerase